MDEAPQRPPWFLRVPALLVGAALVACVALLGGRASAQAGYLTNGDFESGTSGWTPIGGATFEVDASTGGVAGPSAAHLTSTSIGGMKLWSQWWLSPTILPGGGYAVEAWLLDDDPDVNAWLTLEFLDANGTSLSFESSSPLQGDDPAYRRLSAEHTAPAGAAYARVVLEASAGAIGATLAVDGVVLVQSAAPPSVVPTVQPSPPPLSSTVTPTQTPTPVQTATPTKTATPAKTATPTPTPRPIGPQLWNASFEDGTEGWDPVRGNIEVGAIDGRPGRGLLLRSDADATAWVEQSVIVAPGEWYELRALLIPVDGVRAGWARIAWYPTGDATGAQIETDDSDVVGVAGAALNVAGGTVVTTGPVQAPAAAHSARVRILVQPYPGGSATLAIDDVLLMRSSPPQAAPTPSPASTPRATTTVTGTPTVAATPRTAGVTARGTSTGTAAVAAAVPGQEQVRITELLPDPVQPGRDADYEWVELTNLGASPVDIAGMALRDGQASTDLASAIIPPGASVVIAGASAEVDSDVRLDGPIGNGLGNDGDRLELVDAAGNIVDVVVYGAGSALLPGPGETVQRWFGPGTSLSGEAVGPPSPGLHGTPTPGSGTTTSTSTATLTAADAGSPGDEDGAEPAGADRLAWMLLLAVGGGAVGGAVIQRFMR